MIRTEREHCCDDFVVAVRGNAHEYAVALTALETRRWTGEPVLASTGGNLVKRIHRLLNHSERPHAALTPAFSAGLIVLTAAVALTAWQPKPDERPQEPRAQSAETPYLRWLTQDVAYIIADQERAPSGRLNADAERSALSSSSGCGEIRLPGHPRTR